MFFLNEGFGSLNLITGHEIGTDLSEIALRVLGLINFYWTIRISYFLSNFNFGKFSSEF